MKPHLLSAAILSIAVSSFALDGQIGIHDPSTVIKSNGKYFTWGTGGSALESDDGWTWHSGTRALRGGMAPDVINVGDRYYQYMGDNVGGQPNGHITMISNKSLDPNSPDFKWEEGGQVAMSDGLEDSNAIDPGLFLDPNDGKLWLVYGSYFGYIRLVQLDPKTGKRLDPNDKFVNVAINCEAAILIYREGWYYLLGTHGSCCNGAGSGYNIRVGRSKQVTGPYVDHEGIDMIMSGGKLFLGSTSRLIGAGHFGLIDEGDGVQKFSMHWEADLDRGGASVLDIRPLLWKDGWPVAGENLKPGNYVIESARTGTALEIAVEGVTVGGGRGGRGGRGGGGRGGPGLGAGPGGQPAPGIINDTNAVAGRGARGGGAPGGRGGGGLFGGTGGVIPSQDVAQVSTNWPTGNIAVRMANFLDQAQQKWSIAVATNSGGYLGAPYFKITIAGTDRALAVADDGELVSLPAFTGGPEQLWRIEQLPDGSWRIMPKSVPNSKEPLALSAIGSSFATLAKFNPESVKQRWNIK